MGILISIIWSLIILGVIIFFHELGHFVAAKKLGIKVERFSIGFGPKMIGFTKGDTEYRISWLPLLGGYVKMLGENPGERPDGEIIEEAEPEEGRFDLAPVSHRVIVAVSGPAMNVVLAILLFAGSYMFGIPDDPEAFITHVDPDSSASRAGIMSGDKILSINGYKVKAWSDIRENVVTRPEEELEIALLRNEDERVTVHATPERMEIPVISVSPTLQSELDNGVISADLRQEFGFSKVPLSFDAVVSVEEAGSSWLITDVNGKYSIKREEDSLNIYQEMDAQDAVPVFSIDLALRNELALLNGLDSSIPPEGLRQKFAATNNKLSEKATVLVEEAGGRWLITDKSYGKGIFKWIIPSKDRQYPVRREDGKLNVYLQVDYGLLGIRHSSRAIVRELESGSTVHKAGLRLGDAIEAVNNKEIMYNEDFLAELQDVSGESVALTVRRDADTTEVPVPLEYDEYGRLISFKGLSFENIVRRNPIKALVMAVPQTVRMGGKIFQFLKRMVTRDVSFSFVAGPLGIVQIAMLAVSDGVASTLQFAGFLSVNLSVVNLLPLFITDGAMIVFLIIEWLRRKPMAQRKQMIVQQVGVGFIMLLFLLITYNDIIRLVRGGL
ncbi:RIP metalloprotease RseP [Candidatus Poribacteria bacterium]